MYTNSSSEINPSSIVDVGLVRGRMAFDEREVMMCYLLRHPGVFLEARSILKPEHFTEPYEIIWLACWRACLDLYEQFSAMPSHLVLEAEALYRISEHPDEVPPSGVEELRSFLAHMFDVDMSGLLGPYESYGFELLQRFLNERHWADPIRNYLREIGDNVPANLPELMGVYSSRLDAIQAVGNQNRFKLYTAEEFLATDFAMTWLLEPFLVAGQPALIGGPAKALKTSLALDMAVCVCLGTTSLLGHFQLRQPRRNVGFLSGESGGATIKDTLRRICTARGISAPSGLDICLRVPRLHDELSQLTRIIRQNAWKAVFLDPLYLMLLAGHTDANAAANIYRMGELLDRLCRACLELDCTPVLIHHTTKHLAGRNGNQVFEPLELTDIHGAGIAEHTRQWILINRREAFEDGANNDRVWLRYGGSAGHSGLWGVDVDQGEFNPRTCTRQHWRVSIRSATGARESAERRRHEQRGARDAAEYANIEVRVLETLRSHPEGLIISRLRDLLCAGRNNVKVTHVLARMGVAGTVTCTPEERRVGRTTRTLEVYRLAHDPTLLSSIPSCTGDGRASCPAPPASP